MPVITKELALRIVKKLNAEVTQRSNRPHDLACVFEGETLLAQFGIRRGSKKDLGHDHIPDQIHLRPAQARLLAQCPLSRAEWLAILKEKGLA